MIYSGYMAIPNKLEFISQHLTDSKLISSRIQYDQFKIDSVFYLIDQFSNSKDCIEIFIEISIL